MNIKRRINDITENHSLQPELLRFPWNCWDL